MRSRYLKRDSFFEHIKTKGSSFVWQGILSSRSFLKKGCCFRIGNGLKINIWKDPWIPEIPEIMSKVREGVDVSRLERLVDLKESHNTDWNEGLIRSLFMEDTTEIILRMKWPVNTGEDKLFW